MDLERQKKAPIYEALEKFRKKRVVPFDVPGHKRGRGNPELVELLGEKCVNLDVNSMKPLAFVPSRTDEGATPSQSVPSYPLGNQRV